MALPILNEEKVRKLAHVIRYQEANAISVLNFSTEAQRSKYLKDSKWNYDTVVALLDSAAQLKAKLQGDGVWGPLAADFHAYLVYSANAALQTMPHYLLRRGYLERVKEHSDRFTGSLHELDPAKVDELAEEALNHKVVTLRYLSSYRSTAPRSFSQWIKSSSGTSLEQPVQRYQAEAGYRGPFKDLEVEQKIMVQLMSMESQQPTSTSAGLMKKMSPWDIYPAKHKIEAATRDALVKEAASRVCGASIVGAIAGCLLGSQGGPLSTEGLVSYAPTPLPDGVVLARRIAHQP